MEDIAIAIDFAASGLYNQSDNKYHLTLDNAVLSGVEMVSLLEDWTKRYPLISIEDGCSEIDEERAALLTKRLGKQVQLVGDDMFTTNIKRIRDGVSKGIFNSVLIKMNQIGTVSETMDAIRVSKGSGYLTMVSGRSGETEDVSMTHLAVAANAGQIKCGMAHVERTAKWNELLRIESKLKNRAIYPSKTVYDRFIAKR